MVKDVWRAVLIAMIASLVVGTASAQDDKVESAISLITLLDRPGQINLATVWDGNKYVQCRPMDDRSMRCEAAGALMQPSLAHVLTPERIGHLIARGWVLDPSFGNYARRFAPTTAAKVIAEEIKNMLSQVYDADIEHIEIATNSVADEPCPPRNGPSQNLAGIIFDARAMERFAIHACSYEPKDNAPDVKLGLTTTAAELIAVYGPKVTVEIQRLRLNSRRRAFVVFDTGLGYVQCEPQSEPDGLYCEAQSADSWPALAAILTPERLGRLHDAGYADPGRAPNYSKTYLFDKTSDAAVAAELLTLLHDVYGYYGASKLEVATERR
jgi:hypothetical protein